MKRIATLVVLTCLIVGTSSTAQVFAEQAEPVVIYNDQADAFVEFDMIQIEGNGEFSDTGIEPYKTIPGSRGVSTIDYMESFSMITWSVKPDTSLPYTFSGAMKIFDDDTGKRVGWEDLEESGMGRLAGEVDLYGLGLKRGHSYRAVLTGTAVDGAGEMFYVPSGAFLPFKY